MFNKPTGYKICHQIIKIYSTKCTFQVEEHFRVINNHIISIFNMSKMNSKSIQLWNPKLE